MAIDDGDEDTLDLQRARAAMIVILIVVAGLGITDLVLDAPTDWLTAHVLLELTLVGISLGGLAYLGWRWKEAEGSLARTRVALRARSAEAVAWQRKAEGALQGLGRAINEQFTAWELTPAEREVAVLLLQGHGHKQIAFRTQRSERTVRQHAVAVYAKSGLAGRAELAAYFLEGIVLPPPAAE
jgi:DNA-binding CsgD family transcriptional regulator